MQNSNEILFPPLNYTSINLILNTIITAVFPKTFLAKIKPRKSKQMKEKGKNGARKVKEVRTNVLWVKWVNESWVMSQWVNESDLKTIKILVEPIK